MTLRDAAGYVLELPEKRKAHLAWQHTAELMMAAAAPKATQADLERAQRQLETTLRADGVLGLKDAHSRPRSRPRWRR